MRLPIEKKYSARLFSAGMIVMAWGLCGVKAQDQYLIRPKSVQKQVSFETDDGWRIYGTLTLPESLREGQRLPAALLVHGIGDRR